MGLFAGMTADGHEERQDRLGGFGRLDTDVYAGKIKVAYAGKSEAGAHNITVVAELGGQEYRETVYVTNKKGQTFFEKDGKRHALPGFNIIDDLCQIATDKPLSEQDTEEKVVKVYDYDARAEVNKSVQVLTGLTGAPILVAIEKVLENKNGPAPDYAPTAETREVNNILHVFHPELRVTVVEAKAGKEAAFIDAWTERNKGNTRDKRTIKDGQGAQTGRPGKANSGPPQAGGAKAPSKSLFGAKKD